MHFSQREIAQFSALLCRYPDFTPPNEDEEEEVKQIYAARIQWEKRLLGRKFTVKKDGVEIFSPTNITEPRSSRNTLHASVVDGVSLCGHHAIGKKKSFAQFVKAVGLDLDDTMSRYSSRFDTALVRRWMISYLTRPIAGSVANTHVYITQTTALVSQVLAGNECYYGDSLYVQTDCKACQICSFVSVTSVLPRLTHIINAEGSEFLQSFLTHIYAQVNAMIPSVDLQTASSFFPNLSLVEKMMLDPPTDPLHTFQNAIADREKMSKSKNNKSGNIVSAGDSQKDTARCVNVSVGESSKSFGGKEDDNVVVEVYGK